jgi:hypothetical protein
MLTKNEKNHTITHPRSIAIPKDLKINLKSVQDSIN